MKSTFKESSRLHLALNTNQFDRSIDFYQALFNIKPSKVKSGYAKFDVENPPVNLTLNEVNQISGNQISHLGIEIKTSKDVKKQLERLKALGLETRWKRAQLVVMQNKIKCGSLILTGMPGKRLLF